MNPAEPASNVPVAIIGMGCLFPKADSLARYWVNIRGGVDAIREIPATHWNPDDYHDADPKSPDRTYARRGGFLDPVDFPALDFGIAPTNLDATDTTQLLGLMVAKAALDDAGYGSDKEFDRDRVSVVLGVTGALELVIPLGARLGHPIWRRALKEAGVAEPIASDVVKRIGDSYVGWQENSFPGLLGNVAAGRIANRLDLGGTNCVVDAACASSLGAVHLAMLELAAGRCDLALTGGLDTFNDIFMYMCFSKTPALSPSGDSKPFSALGDGTALGEGLGVLTLKRLDDARRDGDRIYAVIKGVGSASDGKGTAVYAPKASGQVKCLNRAYEAAGISPSTVELVEGHGTGTKVGDAVELSALAEVYRSAKADGTWCALGSVKSQIGHTKAAAGAAGLIKAALALYHKVLPPTIKVDRPSDLAMPGASPFYLNTEARPWLPNPDHPRRAAVSAFGFGGSNFHCVLEEADAEAPGVDWDGDVQLVAMSGATPEALRSQLAAWPETATWDAFRVEAARSRSTFQVGDHARILIVAEREGTAWSKLVDRATSMIGDKPATSPEGIYYGLGTDPGGLGVLFPGQGSQYVGMLRDLACRFPSMLDTLAHADGVTDRIYPHPTFDSEGKAAADHALRSTDVAQPAIGAIGLGCWRVLEDFGLRADAMAGHSFGELTALCASGRIGEADFFNLANLRGRLMSGDGGDRGGMLAVMAPVEAIERVIADEKLDLVIANRNAPRQSVLSGPGIEIKRAAAAFEKGGISTRTLEVAAAFHSRYVSDASKPLLDALKNVQVEPGGVQVFANTSALPYPVASEAARVLLAEQLAKPVRFVEQIQAMAASGVRTFLEVGPDARLTGLVNAILDGQGVTTIAMDAGKGKRGNVLDLARTLAHLAAIGHPIQLDSWDDGAAQLAKPVRKPGLTVKVSGANFAPKPTVRPALVPEPVQNQPKILASPTARVPGTEPRGTLDSGRRSSSMSKSNPPSPTREIAPSMSHRPEPRPTPPAVATNGHLPSAKAVHVASSAMAEALRASEATLQALQALAERTSDLHRQFLEGQDRATQTFQSLLDHQQKLTLATLGQRAEPSGATGSVLRPRAVAPATRGRSTEPVAPQPAPKPRSVEAPRPLIAASAPARVVAPVAPAIDVHKVLAEVVSEKTGYPADVLEPAMQLDADLGIDSIKRVEILAAIQERLPNAPIIGPEHLGTIRTLGQIAEFLGAVAVIASPAPVAAANDVLKILAEVVSEKTGYPPDVLEPGMQLDADLGIDSIKRVEILAAIQERLPNAPIIGPEHLGTIRTLGQIAEFLGASSAPASISVAAPNDVQRILTEVVSEKTGYPADVLEMGMQMDSDLGIDSIKRVEILAAIQERLPDAPIIGPEHLGTIRTLGQIAEFLGGTATTVAIPVPKALPTLVEAVPVRRLIPFTLAIGPGDRREVVTAIEGGEVWVVDDGSDLTAELVDRLRGIGFAARVVSRSTIASMRAPDRLAGLVLIASDALSIGNAFRVLRTAAPALKRAGSEGGSSFVTVTRLGGTFGIDGLAGGSIVETGALAGLAKTAAREWPEVNGKAIDLDPTLPADSAARSIVEEMFRRGPIEVGLGEQGKKGISLRSVAIDGSKARDPLTPGDLILITGGARGVTAEVAVALASAFRPTIALLGRSAAPSPEPAWLAPLRDEAEIKRALHAKGEAATPQALGERCREVMANREVVANLERIEAAGATAVYRSVDVREKLAVKSIVDGLRSEFGPVRGVVHGAGVLADRKIEDQTDEQFARVFETKVAGLDAVLNAVKGDDLRALVLFSSTTARLGRSGQVAYAAANEALNKKAQLEAANRPDCRVVSVNWGPWDGGMVTPSLRPLFEAEGIALIPMAEGAKYLVDELRSTSARPVEVVILGGGGPEPTFVDSAPEVVEDAAGSTMAKVFERMLDVDSTPILRSHVMDGRPVLPMALILEWLAQGAMTRHPGLVCSGVDDLRLLKGVVLRDGLGESIRVLAGKATRKGGQTSVPVELRGVLADGREVLHARAEVVLDDRYPSPEPAEPEPTLPAYAGTSVEIYGEVLFHGPDLQGIDRVDGCGDGGIVADVATAPLPSTWLDKPLRQQWVTDPLALDCAFQLMILWSVDRLGSGSLPTFVGRYRQFRRAFPAGIVRVVARVTDSSAHKARADVDFLDAEGEPVARIEDYECVIDASLKSAFRRNGAAGVESK